MNGDYLCLIAMNCASLWWIVIQTVRNKQYTEYTDEWWLTGVVPLVNEHNYGKSLFFIGKSIPFFMACFQ